MRADLAAFETELAAIPRGARVVHAAAHHLLDLRGKHLRPLCVALASRFGDGFTDQARALAVAVELVHSATLLHDDVVDVAERRRGEPAACVVYGNAASIFAGDWLLVAALRRIAAAGVDGLLDRMLAVIDEMIVAESIQLERRGNVTGSRDDYFAIVEGKTAALFRWAMVAGARVARLSPRRPSPRSSGSGSTSASRSRRSTTSSTSTRQRVDGGGDPAGFAGGAGGKAPRGSRHGQGPARRSARGQDHVPAGRRARARSGAARAAESRCSRSPSRGATSCVAIAAAVRATGALAATRALAEEHVERALEVARGAARRRAARRAGHRRARLAGEDVVTGPSAVPGRRRRPPRRPSWSRRRSAAARCSTGSRRATTR